LVQENPSLVRQQLLQSGLSEREIRAQLNAAGLPADALDQFLSGDSIDALTVFDDNALSALQTLGIAVETADGLEFVSVISGMQLDTDG
jgi:polysaccharide export outer membrane protein